MLQHRTLLLRRSGTAGRPRQTQASIEKSSMLAWRPQPMSLAADEPWSELNLTLERSM